MEERGWQVPQPFRLLPCGSGFLTAHRPFPQWAAVTAETPQASQSQATHSLPSLLHSELGPKSYWGPEPVPHLFAPKQDPSSQSRKGQFLSPFLMGSFFCSLTNILPTSHLLQPMLTSFPCLLTVLQIAKTGKQRPQTGLRFG